MEENESIEDDELEQSENDQIKELDEEYESDELSDNYLSPKKANIDAYDDIYLNHILKFTEKEIKKNKELTEENSRKNSSITVNF